jgi:hypothetical protein
MDKQLRLEKIEITLYTDLEPVYGIYGQVESDPPEWRGLLEQLIAAAKANEFSLRHYYDNGAIKDYETW